MAQITIMNETLPEATSQTSDRTFFDFPNGTITRYTPPSEIASDYTMILDGTTYQVNYFLNGDTKIKAAYRTNNHDTLTIQLYKNDGHVEVIGRQAEITIEQGMNIKLICNTEIHDDLGVKNAFVRLTPFKAVKITYDEINDVIDFVEVE